jgi:RhoGAP domain
MQPVFGVPLEELTHEQEREIPFVVTDCVSFLEKYALDTEGLFRKPGRVSSVFELRSKYNSVSRSVDLTPYANDIHVVGSLLKRFFSDMPEPVVPFRLYDSFVSIFGRL